MVLNVGFVQAYAAGLVDDDELLWDLEDDM